MSQGDHNTGFYYVTTVVKRKHNKIESLKLDSGGIVHAIGCSQKSCYELFCSSFWPAGVYENSFTPQQYCVIL